MKIKGIESKSINIKVGRFEAITSIMEDMGYLPNGDEYIEVSKDENGNDILVVMENISYHGSPHYKQKEILTKDKNEVELFIHLEKARYLLRKFRDKYGEDIKFIR